MSKHVAGWRSFWARTFRLWRRSPDVPAVPPTASDTASAQAPLAEAGWANMPAVPLTANNTSLQQQVGFRPNGKKILLVEDNEYNRSMLVRRLNRHGFEVVVAVDGGEGVEKARSERPDLILMDMHLPVLEGWEATRRLKESDDTRAIPIIAVTADAMAGDREKALEAGCDDYDTKPIELPRLLEKIGNLLEPGGTRLPRHQAQNAQKGKQGAVTVPTAAPDPLQAALSAIVGGFCHDLANDLSVIRMLLEEIPAGPETEKLGHVVNRASDAIADLHRFVKQGATHGELPSLTLAAENVRPVLAGFAEDRLGETQLGLELASGLDAFAFPSVLFRHLLSPLVNNACEATRGWGCVDVSLALLDPESDFQIVVDDSGPGWAPSAEEVTRAIRSGKRVSTKGPNRGAGLRNVWRIVSRLGGRISLTASPRGGARVEVVLPGEITNAYRSGPQR